MVPRKLFRAVVPAIGKRGQDDPYVTHAVRVEGTHRCFTPERSPLRTPDLDPVREPLTQEECGRVCGPGRHRQRLAEDRHVKHLQQARQRLLALPPREDIALEVLGRTWPINPLTRYPQGDYWTLRNLTVPVTIDAARVREAKYGFAAWFNWSREGAELETNRKAMGAFIRDEILRAIDPIWFGQHVPNPAVVQLMDLANRVNERPLTQEQWDRIQEYNLQVREIAKIAKTWSLDFTIVAPEVNWSADPYWVVWFLDAMDQLGVGVHRPDGTLRLRIRVANQAQHMATQRIHTHLVYEQQALPGVEEGGPGGTRQVVTEEKHIVPQNSVFLHDVTYYRYRHPADDDDPAQCIEPCVAIESTVPFPWASYRLIVPPTSAASAIGESGTRHYYVQPVLPSDGRQRWLEVSFTTHDAQSVRNLARSALDMALGKVIKAGEKLQYLGVNVFDYKERPQPRAGNSVVDFSNLVPELQPRVPIPLEVVLKASSVALTAPWSEGTRDTISARVLQELQKLKLFYNTDDLAVVCSAVQTLCAQSLAKSAKCEAAHLRRSTGLFKPVADLRVLRAAAGFP